ncbi:interferon-induced protein 44-like, partial [Mercenaria mercenaria]|uniref:interferon-induced protein 44-like n=1 Tax=Mercenaria mercenaria TaxID=6596 RepID=UPI00234EDE38
FNLKKPVDKEENYYISNPKEENKTQCVIFVFDSSKPINADVKYLQDMEKISRELFKQGIPRIAVLTKVDELCSFVRDDISYIYHSKPVRDKIQALSEIMGLPISHIHPLKNYTHEQFTDDMKDIPILIALKRAFDFANDYLEQLMAGGKLS